VCILFKGFFFFKIKKECKGSSIIAAGNNFSFFRQFSACVSFFYGNGWEEEGKFTYGLKCDTVL